jgi:hypothetical protein
MFEFIATESAYVRDLQLIVEVSYQRDHRFVPPDGVLVGILHAFAV